MHRVITLCVVSILLCQIMFIMPVQAGRVGLEKEKAELNWKHQLLFAAEDFATLDLSMNKLQREYEAGKWSDQDLNNLFFVPFSGHALEFEKIYTKWIKAHPKSYAARQLRGFYFDRLMTKHYREAWAKRPFKNLKGVPSEQADKIKHYAALALKDYKAAIKLGAKKPVLAYRGMIRVYASLGDITTSQKVFALGLKTAPQNVIVRQIYMGWLDSKEYYKSESSLAKMRKIVNELPSDKTRSTYKDVVNIFHMRLLKDGQYAELDKRLNRIQKDYEAGTVDDRTLFLYFYALGEATPEYTENFNLWVKKYPKSYAARQARGTYFLSAAWKARGEAYAADTSKSELKGLGHYWERALRDTKDAITLTAKPTLSYRTRVTLFMAMGEDYNVKVSLEHANHIAPKNTIVRRAYMHYLQGRWGGNLEEMEAYLEHVKEIGLPHDVVRSFEDAILTEKKWLAEQHKKNFDKMGKLVTGL